MLYAILTFVWRLFFDRGSLAAIAGPLLPLVLHWTPLKRVANGLTSDFMGALCETVPMRDKEWIARHAVRCKNLELLQTALKFGVPASGGRYDLLEEAVSVRWYGGARELMDSGAAWDSSELLEQRYEECRSEMREIALIVDMLKTFSDNDDAVDYFQAAWAAEAHSSQEDTGYDPERGDRQVEYEEFIETTLRSRDDVDQVEPDSGNEEEGEPGTEFEGPETGDAFPWTEEILATTPTEWDLEPTEANYAAWTSLPSMVSATVSDAGPFPASPPE